MKHKALAILLCLALVLTMALPGTLAVSVDEDGSESLLAVDTCTCGTQDDNHTEGCPLYVAPEESAICTCNQEAGIHAEDCPLYDAGDDSETEETTESTEVEEKPEGTPPESWGSSSLAGAIPFTNVAPLMQFDYGLSTLELNDEDYGLAPVAGNNDNGIVLNKTAIAKADGTFDITLEAYVTGEQTTVGRYDPVDIVLVLDTSGSMREGMSMDDYEIRYIASDYKPAQYEKSYILQDGEFVVVMYTGYRWAILNGNAYGNTVVPKSSASDSAQSYMEIYDGIDTSKTYYVAFTQGNSNSLVYHAVTYRTRNGQTGWFREGDLDSRPRVPKTAPGSEGSTFYQYQESVPFYKVKDGQNKLDTLKSCVDTFIRNSLNTSPESSIAIVPFGATVGTVTDFTSNKDVLTQAVQNLTADGATNSGAAMQEAASRINSLDSSHSDHKKIVIMFTDGEPTTNNDFDATVADTAIRASYGLKQKLVTVYTIGVFAGANGNLESVSTSDVNKYMHLVSSNYPDAQNWTVAGEPNDQLNGKSYYLSATNSGELGLIFQRIYEEVGGATNTALGTSTVVKDIIAPSFTVPANTSDIKIYTANCTGAGLTFGNRTPATGVTATITDDTLDVTGFDFSNNWCGSHSGTYSGKKLIIEFTVSPKEGFLGGNGVPTNGNTSGLYSNGTPVGLFEVPTVNVPIADITIEAKDKNVYLTQVPTDDQLKTGVTIKCGNVDITDPSKLEDWQKAYVDIESTSTISNGFNATVDGEYTVTATVNPKETGDSSKSGTVATGKTGTKTNTINVFKPELTYKDSDVYYGDNAPTSFEGNLTKTEWKHGNTLDTAATMIGTKPTLALTYTPEVGKIESNKIATKKDFAVDVSVKIGQTDVGSYTTFQHTDCTEKTCGKPTNGKFWLHVKTCQLTITKTGGANQESYVFDVCKDGEKYTEVTIWGNRSEMIYELPVGTYTIQENTGWSWRYNPTYGNNGAVLSAQKTSDTITCTNSSTTDKWLNGFSTIVKNVFSVTNEQTSN